jgi:hypothetical protein
MANARHAPRRLMAQGVVLGDQTVRNLANLENTASTARVLNLRAVGAAKGGLPEYSAAPMFQNPALNASIIVKHRLRRGETDLFATTRRSATKIMIPINSSDLNLGARYVFIGQRKFKEALLESFGIALSDTSRDHRTLSVLDLTPTLDPFLLREQLRRLDLEPARCYFELSEADADRMFAFAQREIEPLIRMSIGDAAESQTHAARLTRKILANNADADLEPLRQTMQLDRPQFLEGAFCWKAFLYYKWQLADILPRVAPVLEEIGQIKPVGPQSDEDRAYLISARETLRKSLVAACRGVKSTLGIYDAAYQRLTQQSDPSAFRDFLLNAPALFNELGERLGGVEHVISFWRFRFPAKKRPLVTPGELVSVFMDFEASLGADHVKVPSILKQPEVIDARDVG